MCQLNHISGLQILIQSNCTREIPYTDFPEEPRNFGMRIAPGTLGQVLERDNIGPERIASLLLIAATRFQHVREKGVIIL